MFELDAFPHAEIRINKIIRDDNFLILIFDKSVPKTKQFFSIYIILIIGIEIALLTYKLCFTLLVHR